MYPHGYNEEYERGCNVCLLFQILKERKSKNNRLYLLIYNLGFLA